MQTDTKAPNRWGVYVRRGLLVAGALSVLYALLSSCLYVLGWGQWQKDGTSIESPSQRYTVSPAVIVYPRLKFGLVMSDHETGEEGIVAGWTRRFPWSRNIAWTAEKRLRVEYYELNSLQWGRKVELFGVEIDWVLIPDE